MIDSYGTPSRPDDIPEAVWHSCWWAQAHGLQEAASRQIMAAKAEEREASALVVEVECDRILSKQDGRDATVDSNLRMIACILPDLADTIRKRGEAD